MNGPSQTAPHSTICIIGAGPAGLAALKIIKDAPQFLRGDWAVAVFEARERLGGIWNPALPDSDPPLTPLYDSMTTNIPHPVMAYDSYPFPPSTPIFPPASTVLTYLESYAKHFDLLPYIRFQTTVTNVSWDNSIFKWAVSLGSEEQMLFDRVIVANGHFRVPRYPNIPGLDSWLSSGRATHSAWYRRPDDIGTASTVLVVGAGPSGSDISTELCGRAKTVFHSMTGGGGGGSDKATASGLVSKTRVIRLDVDGTVEFEDGSIEHGIDRCIFATGYQFAFPFFSVDALPTYTPTSHLTRDLCRSTYHVFPLAKHIFPIQAKYPPTSLAFMGLLLRGTPLSLFEAQAQAIVKTYEDPASLDISRAVEEIQDRQRQLRDQFGAAGDLAVAREWHRYTEPESFVYRDSLYEFAGSDRRVEDWEKEMWDRKFELRDKWRRLLASGQSELWLTNIGAGGQKEWVQFLQKILDTVQL